MDEPRSPTIASSLLHGAHSDIEQQAKVKLPAEGQQGSGATVEQQADTFSTRCYDLLVRGTSNKAKGFQGELCTVAQGEP